MPTRRIMGTSGGFRSTDRWGVIEPGETVKRMLQLTGKERPRLTFVMTATGDDRRYLVLCYSEFRGWSVDLHHFELFPQPNVDARELLLNSDAIWVGGGSVANLLELWRLHGVDEVMREAWEAGVVLGGVSAGSLCWHTGGTTDSFGPKLEPVTNGLGFLPYANGVHFDSEEQRRPLIHKLIGDQTLDAAYATDDGVGILYEGTDAIEVITDARDADSEAKAYWIERADDGSVNETPLPAGPIR